MIEQHLSQLAEMWFLHEPILFGIFCMHKQRKNMRIACPVRCGKGLIEYNPVVLESIDFAKFEEMMKVEIIRILLKHPYQRKPSNCSNSACTEGSNCTISDNYEMEYYNIARPMDYWLEAGHSYEFYAKEINKKFKEQRPWAIGKEIYDNPNGAMLKNKNDAEEEDPNGDGGKHNGQHKNESQEKEQEQKIENEPEENDPLEDQSQLWGDDALQCEDINTIIRQTDTEVGWGSIPDKLVSQIIASTKARIDYRKVLAGFRMSVTSSKRSLTRMRPNRRTGFSNMGSIHRMSSKLLIAIDVSGSITDGELAAFYGIVNRFFKYGITQLDIIQFDCEIVSVLPMDKAKQNVKITGRGGTSFQPVIDYANSHKEYDGLIIFTDGFAPKPMLPRHFKPTVLWVLTGHYPQLTCTNWMKETGRVCNIEIRNNGI